MTSVAGRDSIPWITDLKSEGYDHEVYQNRLKFLDSEFVKHYGSHPQFFSRAPGRVNLIGEHIDYEGYAVLPMAISQDTIIAVRVIPSHLDEDGDGEGEGKVINSSSPPFPSLKIANIRSQLYPSYEFEANPQQEVNLDKHCWANYFLCGYKGVFDYLRKNDIELNKKYSFEIMVDGIVPTGAGLSSSAALVCSSFISVMNAKNLSLSKTVIADNCCVCERYIGTQSGGMDQAISIMAKAGYAKLIDFHPLRAKDVLLPQDALLVISNSCTVSNKAESASKHYNYRVLECTLAAIILSIKEGMKEKEAISTISTLQDFEKYIFQKWKQNGLGIPEMEKIVQKHLHDEAYTEEEISTLLQKPLIQIFENSKASLNVLKIAKEFKLKQRALHVYSESNRVISFHDVANSLHDDVNSSLSSDEILNALGKLMNESHHSCSELYECSCAELDSLVSICKTSGALGARLTGAGWGGCVVSLIKKEQEKAFISFVKDEYFKPLVLNGVIKEEDLDDYIFATKPSGGAAIFPFSLIE